LEYRFAVECVQVNPGFPPDKRHKDYAIFAEKQRLLRFFGFNYIIC